MTHPDRALFDELEVTTELNGAISHVGGWLIDPTVLLMGVVRFLDHRTIMTWLTVEEREAPAALDDQIFRICSPKRISGKNGRGRNV